MAQTEVEVEVKVDVHAVTRLARSAIEREAERMPRANRLGVIGAGMISDEYLRNLSSFPELSVIAVGDLSLERARQRALQHGIAIVGTSDEVLNHPDVDIIVNLTIPQAHAAVSRAALAAGKHVWSEKPLATNRRDARDLIDLANGRGLRIGVAPDTVLGPGMETARRAIAHGAIGVAVAAAATMQYPGPDIFHIDPRFLFDEGAGPLFDMGPYYITALVRLLGPISRVAALGATARTRRTIRVGPLAGSSFPVHVPTHVEALLEFSAGQVGQVTLSFDSPLVRIGSLEVTGTNATLATPDPNTFDTRSRITRPATFDMLTQQARWQDLEPAGGPVGRGIGVLDMARAIHAGHPHAASAEVGLHVLDVLICIDEAVRLGVWQPVETAREYAVELDSAVATTLTDEGSS